MKRTTGRRACSRKPRDYYPWASVVAALILLILEQTTFAQPPARPLRETVTIPVDAEAAKMLQILEDRWPGGKWTELVETIVELCETRGRSVVNFEPGVSGGTARYGLVQTACDRLIAALPPEGLAAYRRRIDPTAERWFRDWQKTSDRGLLERLVRQAYYSSWGDDALWELGQSAWNDGDFHAARRWWSQLLPHRENTDERRFPDASQLPADIAARLVLCWIFAGEQDRAGEALDAFSQQFGDAPGALAGRRAPWRELLADVFEDSQTWTRPVVKEDVPTFGGAATRSMVSPRAIDIGTEQWSVPLTPTRLPEMPRVTLFPAPLPLVYHPAVVDGRVYVNEGRRILAFDLATGLPAWGKQAPSPPAPLPAKTPDEGSKAAPAPPPLEVPGEGSRDAATIYPVVEDDQQPSPARPVSGGPCWTVTVADGRLFARMGSAVTTPSPHELRDLPNELVCLDVAEGQGRLLWKRTSEEFNASLHDLADAPLWNWEGSPVAQGGRVYAALSRRRPQLEWSVACLDAETGLLLWHRPVGISRPTPPDHENRASQLLLTLGDGRLFLSTDWGAIVAVDAAEGQLQWAVTYESQPMTLPVAVPSPRTYPSPSVSADGRLYVAPLDSEHVLCLNAATGETIWRARANERLTSVIGVAQGRFIVAGNSLWAFDTNTGERAWSVQQAEPDDFGYGRGWLAGNVVYWTSRQALFVFDQRTGQPLRDKPLGGIEQPRTGGNVVVAGGMLLIAAGNRLSAYGQFAKPRPRQADVVKGVDAIDTATPARRASEGIFERSTKLARWHIGLVTRRDHQPDRTQVIGAPSGYWRRAWQRTLSPGERIIVPEGPPPVVDRAVVLCQRRHLLAWDRGTGELRWELPLDASLLWSAESDVALLFATSNEVCAVQADTGRVAWRCPWRTLVQGNGVMPPSSAVFHRDQHGLLIVAPECGFLWCDEETGVVRRRQLFRDDRPPPQIVITPGKLALWDIGRRRLDEWDFTTGAPRRHMAWSDLNGIAAPQPVRNGWAVITEDRRLVWLSPQLQWERDYDVVAFAHAEPMLVSGSLPSVPDTFSTVLIDGHTLVGLRLDGAQVFPRWSQPLVALPLSKPREQVAVDGTRVFAAAGGVLRAVDVVTGKIAWERAVELPDPLRVVSLSYADAVAVLPLGPAATPISSVLLRDAVTGKPVQQIALTNPTREVTLHVDAAGIMVVAESEIVSLR